MSPQAARFQALLEAAPDAMIVVDDSGTIQLANAEAERLFGYQRAELLGSRIEMLVPDRARSAHVAHRTGYSRAPRTRPMGAGLELFGRRKDASEFPVEISLSPVETDEGTVIISAIRDITDRRRAEEERLRLLQERAAHAEASRIKDEFIATLSHELRTPLNAILGWASLLREGRLSAQDADNALATIERNARVQSQLIEDLLDVSRIVTGKLRLHMQLVDLAGVLESAIDVIRPSATARPVALEVAIATRPVLVRGDADRLQQAIWNVLSNAVKFTGPHGRVSVRLDVADATAQLTVRDSGQGIRPEFLAFVFDRFRQWDSSYARTHGGLGLGLAITRSLVELHGGMVSAHSSGEAQGATFRIELPRAQVVGARVSQAAPAESVGADLGGVRILVVDDQHDERELLRAILQGEGARVRVAASTAEALQAIAREAPDLLVTDLAMPGRDGYDLLSTLRSAGGPAAAVPAVAVTAHARAEDRERALAAGFQLYISKPVEPSRLVRAVAALMRDASGARRVT